MKKRIIAAASCMVIAAACSSQSDDTLSVVAKGDEKIACAVNGVTDFTEVCAVERVKKGDVLRLVVHHPNGGFRRFEVRNDGTGLAVADGADDAQRAVVDKKLQLTVGGDQYRFPATIDADGPQP